MPTRIIFLDIDGPVCPTKTYYVDLPGGVSRLGGREVCPTIVGLLNRLCNDLKAKIVISSVWRLGGLDKLRGPFGRAGFDFDHLHEDWRIDVPIGNRSELIQVWLDRHPEVTQYVCIDDEDIVGHPLVQTDHDEGLTFKLFLEVYEKFGTTMYAEFDKRDENTSFDFQQPDYSDPDGD